LLGTGQIPPCTYDGQTCYLGTCDPDTNICNCTGTNYSGVLCNLPPGVTQCDNDQDCFVNYCVNSSCNSSGFCVNDPLDCETDNKCEFASCDPDSGCVFVDQSARCNLNNACSIDSCDNVTGDCIHTAYNCSYLDNECFFGLCDPHGNLSDPCYVQGRICPVPNNCTIAQCYLNYTITESNGTTYQFAGCVNHSVNCISPLIVIGIITGVAIGAALGAFAACLIIAGATVGGSAYAVSQTVRSEDSNLVSNNPLFVPSTRGHAGLHQ